MCDVFVYWMFQSTIKVNQSVVCIFKTFALEYNVIVETGDWEDSRDNQNKKLVAYIRT